MASHRGRRPGLGQRRILAALVRQRRRLAMATVAIALGVGYLAGSLTLLDRVGAGLDALAAAGAERADLIVEGEVAYESALEQTRRLVPASIADPVSAVPGVAAVSSRVEGIAVVLDGDGRAVVAPALSEQPLGTNWPEDPAMVSYDFLGEGRPPTGPDEVVLDERTAREAGARVGQDAVVVASGGPASFSVVGVVATQEGELPDGATLALFSTERARELFDLQDNDNRLAIRLDDGASADQVAATIASILPPGAEVVDGPTGARHRQESLNRSFSLIRVLIVGFAGLALIVGMVTVANSLTLLYAARRRTFAGLRLVGARRSQLLGASLAEASGLALAASVVGAPLGLGLGLLIEAVLGASGTSVPVAGSVLSVPALATAVIIGVVATVLAAVVPAVRACSVAPIEAIAERPAETSVPAAVRLLNAVLVAIGISTMLFGLMVLGDIDTSIAAIAAAVLAGAWVVLSTLPWLLSLAVAGGIRLVPTRPRALRRIAARDAVRHRSRTAATTGALLVATGVVAGLAVFLASFSSAVDSDVRRTVVADLVVDSGTFTTGGLPGELLSDLRASSDVRAVSGWQVGRAWVGDRPLRVTGLDGEDLEELVAPTWVGVGTASLSPGGIALAADVAEQLGVAVGGSVAVRFTSEGSEQLLVEGVYDSGSPLLGDAILDRSVLIRQVPLSFDIAALVALEPDGAAAERVESLVATYGVAEVLEPEQFVDRRSELLRGFERVIQWMLLFTLVQALVGVVNTLLLSVGERRREFGLLRTSGATRRQLHRLVLVEGMSFAVVGTALGLVVGVGVAAAGLRALASFGISGLVVPIPTLALIAAVAMGLGVLAAIVPARWAAAVPPLEAVQDAGDQSSWRGRERTQVPPAVRTPVEPPPFRGVAPRPAPSPSPPRSEPVPPPPPPPEPEPEPEPAVPTPPEPEAEPEPAVPTPPEPEPVPAPTEPEQVSPEPAPRPQVHAAADAARWTRHRDDDDGSVGSPTRGAPGSPFARAPSGVSREVPELDRVARLRLEPSIDQLDPGSVDAAAVALAALARSLGAEERLSGVVTGWVRGVPCAVARTERRWVVVAARFPEPVVESLPTDRVDVALYGAPGASTVSLTIVHRRKLLEVTGVADVRAAAALVDRSGSAPRGDGYF